MTPKKPREQDRKMRAEVLKRDKRTCRMCNRKKVKLQVHHIQRWADAHYMRFDPGNCISLCIPCHKSITGKEVYYAEMLYSILRESK